MDGEFNNFNINNTNITFSASTNNIATSDELSAPLMYQDKMGTNYSRAKKWSRGLTVAGLTIVAVSTGALLTNIYITNPPTIVEDTCQLSMKENVFSYSFEIKNPRGYRVYCYLNVNDEEVFNINCTEEKTYEGSYDELVTGDVGKFYVKFTNRVDYTRTIKTFDFVVGGIVNGSGS